MRRLLLTTCLLFPIAAFAQQGVPQQSTLSTEKPALKPLPQDAPVKSELDKVFRQLSDEVKDADALMAHLADVAKRKPDDIAAEVRNSAKALGALVDRLQGSGDVAGKLAAIRNAATLHLKRVQELPKGQIEEEDRGKLLDMWKEVLKGADNAQASMETMRNSLVNALTKLRMRSTAIGEMMLASQYQEAIDTFTRWIGEMQNTVNSLHRVIGTPGS